MPTGFTYESFQQALVTQIPSLTTDPNFQTILPLVIDYAELSICRDLDLFATHGLLPLGTLAIGNGALPYSTAIVVLEQLFYTLTTSAPQLIAPISYPALTAIYSGAPSGPPKVWCPLPNTPVTGAPFAQLVQVAPLPDATYILTALGTTRPPPLSASNDTTYISLNYPDLFWAAGMIFLAGYNRNFGAMADDPRQAVSWEAEYARLVKPAILEESRKRFQGQAWTAQTTNPQVTPPRK